MKTDETRRLLSEYAAGRISEADRRELMRLASEDQAVFEAVLAEQPFAELMADPAARTELRAALADRPSRGLMGWWWRPWPVAAAATAAVAVFALFVGRHVPLSEKPAAPDVAQLRPASAPPSDRERPALAREAEVASEPAKLKEAKPVGDAGDTLSGKERDRHDRDFRVAGGEGGAAGREPAQVPTRQPEAAEVKKKDGLALNLQPAAPSESQVVVAVPPESREKAVGGVAGGIVGGVVGGITAPREEPKGRADAARPVAASPEPRDERFAKLAGAARQGANYRLWQRTADGTYLPVPAETIFRPGDAVRIELTLAASGYLQAAERLPDGAWQVLYPRAGAAAASLAAGSSVRVPEDGALEIGSPPRDHRIAIFITAEPRPEWFGPGGGGVPRGTAATLEVLIRTSN